MFNRLLFVVALPLILLLSKHSRGMAQAQTFRLVASGSSIWEQNEIPVCWENPAGNQDNQERLWVHDAVTLTWERHSVVRFTGWGRCQPQDRGVRIQIADAGPLTRGLGNELDGRINGMSLNFAFQKWNPSCQSRREFCIRAIAVHEFGHALGLSHEQNRPDTPNFCTDEPQGLDGDLIVTEWDLDSVMNYCNPNWNGDGSLSAKDIQGLQLLYGPKRPLKSFHPGCTSVQQSRSPECMAAMHRFCWLNRKGAAGYPQEIGPDEFGVLCAAVSFYGNVAYSDIPNCAGGAANTQTAACYSSAHRYCDSIGRGGAGIIQELGVGVAWLACVPLSWYHVVEMDELAKMNTGCTSSSAAQAPGCVAAAHRYCSSNGFGMGGVITELGEHAVSLGCITEAAYLGAKV